MVDVKKATGKKSDMDEKDNEVKPTDWDSSRVYILLSNEEDCGEETPAKAAMNTTPRPNQNTLRRCNSCHHLTPVSYTHLDVYKRQVIHRWIISIGPILVVSKIIISIIWVIPLLILQVMPFSLVFSK